VFLLEIRKCGIGILAILHFPKMKSLGNLRIDDMRILVYVENFIVPTVLFIYNEIIQLAKTNEVLVLTTNRITEYDKNFPFNNVVFIPFKTNRIVNKLNWILEKEDIVMNRKNKEFRKKFEKLLETFRPDIIHAHFGYEAIKLLDNLESVNIPVFITFHGYDASELLHRKCYVKKLIFHFRRLNLTPLFVSLHTMETLKKRNVPIENGRVLYCGIDTEYFKPVKKTETSDKIVFIQVSHFGEKKGHIYTLRAFKKFLDSVVKKEKFKLILAGGGVLLEYIKKSANDLGIQQFIEFTGWITHKDLYPLLQEADFFVHHSVTASNGDEEGMPTTIMEAMAMELPVISTWHAGIPEVIDDGVNGYLVNEKDVDTFAKRMKDVLTWGRQPQNREKIQDKFSVEVHNNNLLKFYNEKLFFKANK
jgi:glycosyltransferase involved in cell wall biosynthesis